MRQMLLPVCVFMCVWVLNKEEKEDEKKVGHGAKREKMEQNEN